MAKKNPQKENGYTPIANEIVDALCRISLTSSESRILWCIFRQTYGWGNTKDKISLSQFEKKTDIEHSRICRSIKSLISKNIIIKITNNYVNEYVFQKDYSLWSNVSKKNKKVINSLKDSGQPATGFNKKSSGPLATTPVANQPLKVVANQPLKVVANQPPTKETKTTKETYTKDMSKKNLKSLGQILTENNTLELQENQVLDAESLLLFFNEKFKACKIKNKTLSRATLNKLLKCASFERIYNHIQRMPLDCRVPVGFLRESLAGNGYALKDIKHA